MPPSSSQPLRKRRVVVTGVGAVSPLGVGARPLHDRWVAGESGIVDGVGRASEYEPANHLTVKEARRFDRSAQFIVVAADEALRQAGWLTDAGTDLPYDSLRVGCVIATGIGGIGTMESQHDVMRQRGADRISPLGVPMYMPNAAAAAVSMRYGLQGTSYGLVSACASGGHAVGMALRTIQYGDADAMVTGGTEAVLTEFGFGSFQTMGALASDGISRPFDLRRDGFVMGEGGAALVLEEMESAIARGATILGELAGFGSTADAHHLTAPEPTGRPAAAAISQALVDAGITPAEVSYVNAHGTSTQLNDAAETNALKLALGEHAYRIPVSSTKSAIGHLLGAAGAIEAVATVLALREGMLGPTLNLEVPDPELDLDYIPLTARPLVPVNGGPPAALSNSFAFGGHNVSLLIAGAPEPT
ncbi:beta-ketoacyl synthase [Conexibacter sp. DBS9H8]|uniref:beta-ketoacyl-[acyl-carrier-protein] synthase family protein n=1 Tax=Conexibacter sp. DBS9H8 TaxID=2937801 RepID=UPI00200C68EF|nr:beta-ketoacyl-[acyl-carrier-protein] synthase II [Conexibacter sp. DBS9H8]